jgi:hypothetical protein
MPHETVICDSDGMTSVKNLKNIYKTKKKEWTWFEITLFI